MSGFRAADDRFTSPGEPYPDERRGQPRRRVLLQGKIVSPQRGLSADCLIRNLSQAGARITLSPEAILWAPYLIVVSQAALHKVGAAWRQGHDAGLRLLDRADLDGDVPPHLKAMRQAWLALLPH